MSVCAPHQIYSYSVDTSMILVIVRAHVSVDNILEVMNNWSPGICITCNDNAMGPACSFLDFAIDIRRRCWHTIVKVNAGRKFIPYSSCHPSHTYRGDVISVIMLIFLFLSVGWAVGSFAKQLTKQLIPSCGLKRRITFEMNCQATENITNKFVDYPLVALPVPSLLKLH